VRVRLYVDVELSEPVTPAELDKWAYLISAEFGERLPPEPEPSLVTDYRQGWELEVS